MCSSCSPWEQWWVAGSKSTLPLPSIILQSYFSRAFPKKNVFSQQTMINKYLAEELVYGGWIPIFLVCAAFFGGIFYAQDASMRKKTKKPRTIGTKVAIGLETSECSPNLLTISSTSEVSGCTFITFPLTHNVALTSKVPLSYFRSVSMYWRFVAIRTSMVL